MLSTLLLSRIDSIAAKYGPLAEDVRGHVTLVMFELMQDKHFAKQQTGYHIKRAKWEAQKYVHSLTIYERYVLPEPDILDNNDFADSDFFFEECLASRDAAVEEQVIASEFYCALEAALDTLPTQQRRVARLRMAGYDLQEISQKLGLKSKGGVSDLANRAYANMRQALVSFAL